MFKRFLSHALVAVAIGVLSATFLAWTLDNRVLEPTALSGELRKAGVARELSLLIPKIVTSDKEDSTSEERAEMADKISRAVTAEYVDNKITSIAGSVLTFVREGKPQPIVDLSDFPKQLEAAGVEADGDFADNFAEPIELNKEGKLDVVRDGYKIFSILKYVGIALFALIMLLEWFITDKGQKLKRVSRVFLYSGVSYGVYWLALTLAPGRVESALNESIKATYDTTGLVGAIVRSVQGMLSGYFAAFTLFSFAVAVTLYVIRHYKHGDVLPTKDAKPATKSTKK